MFSVAALPDSDTGEMQQQDKPGPWGPGMSQAQFDFFRALAMTHAGITLPDYKRNMVYRRVSKRLHALRMSDFASYAHLLGGPNGAAEIEFFVNALTTNKTEFFRENHHFEHLTSQVLPALRKQLDRDGSRRLRIWSAGCSSGQEPYSIAMTLANAFSDIARWDARILATDIDTDMVEAGTAGIYPQTEIGTIPSLLRQKYVDALRGGDGGGRMSFVVRSLITFNPLNLHGPWPMKGKFDVIFCRNVIIYFDKPAQRRLFDRYANQMHDGGYLYIGHSESLYKVTERFKPVGQSIYRKVA